MVLTAMGHPESKTRIPTKHSRKLEKPKNTIEPCEKHRKTLDETRKNQKKQRFSGDTGSVMAHVCGIFGFFSFFWFSRVFEVASDVALWSFLVFLVFSNVLSTEIELIVFHSAGSFAKFWDPQHVLI